MRRLVRFLLTTIFFVAVVVLIADLFGVTRGSKAVDIMTVAKPLPAECSMFPRRFMTDSGYLWESDHLLQVPHHTATDASMGFFDVATGRYTGCPFPLAPTGVVSPDGSSMVTSTPADWPHCFIKLVKRGDPHTHAWHFLGTDNCITWFPDSKRFLVTSNVRSFPGAWRNAELYDVRTFTQVGAHCRFYEEYPPMAIDDGGATIVSPAKSDLAEARAQSGDGAVLFYRQIVGHPELRAPYFVKPPPELYDDGWVTISGNGKRLIWWLTSSQTSPLAFIPGLHLPSHTSDTFWISNVDGSGMRKVWYSTAHNVNGLSLSRDGNYACVTLGSTTYTVRVK